MTHPDVITTVWDDPRNVETLKTMWLDGASAAEIADAIGQGATRNAVIGKVHRLKLKPRQPRIGGGPHRTAIGRASHRGNQGAPGQAKGPDIVRRVEAKMKAERARQEGKLSHFGHEPFRPGKLPAGDEGVDVTGLIAFADRRINRECAWIPGDPADGAMCCGKPVKEGSQWCDAHWKRVYGGASA